MSDKLVRTHLIVTAFDYQKSPAFQYDLIVLATEQYSTSLPGIPITVVEGRVSRVKLFS